MLNQVYNKFIICWIKTVTCIHFELFNLDKGIVEVEPKVYILRCQKLKYMGLKMQLQNNDIMT